jgi:hypothetical protein
MFWGLDSKRVRNGEGCEDLMERRREREREKEGDVWCIDSMRLWEKERGARGFDILKNEWIMGFALLNGFF